MSKSQKELQKENYRLLEKLDPRYNKSCMEIITYIRVNTAARSRETEKVLNEFLKQLIQAQREGKSIEQVTRGDSKAFADDLIERLTKRNILSLAAILAVILTGLNLLFDYTIEILFRLIDGAAFITTLSILPFLAEMILTASFGATFVYLVFYIYRKIAFRDWPLWREYGLYFLVGGGLFLVYLLFSHLASSINIGPSFELNMFFIVLLGIAFIVSGIVAFRSENNA
ncbi:hypothetical protein ACFOU0_00930 [Salinicoccus sesuvii]|uniref:DUF1129 family protein n=1 Tax=Salinicoccus sesuvii TaxID=868281 RepID=A0ABV7N2A1_9STAP